MERKAVILEREAAVAKILLNRPDSLNAIDHQFSKDFLAVLDECFWDDKIRAIVITGIGRIFSAGGDVKVMMQHVQKSKPPQTGKILHELTGLFHPVIMAIRKIRKPVIAAVNGGALGGGFGIALACDMIVAGESTRFNMAYILVGLVPDCGSSFFLTRNLGIQKASELIFTGRMIDSTEAYRLNLVNKIVPDEKVVEEAMIEAKKLSHGPAHALSLAKELINKALFSSLEEQLEYEREAITEAGKDPDFKEGLQAFFEKRKPEFFKKR